MSKSLFLDPAIAKQYECVICFEIYKEPVQIGCEEHIFCSECIKELISQQGRSFLCPLCRIQCESNKLTRVKFIDRQINDLRVQCPNVIQREEHITNTNNHNDNGTALRTSGRSTNNKYSSLKRKRSFDDENTVNMNPNKKRKLNDEEMCQWKGTYSDLKHHIEQCPNQFIECKYCKSWMYQMKLKEHHNECRCFPMQCTQCKKTGILRENMESHITQNCPVAIIHCDECKQKIQRKNREFHVNNECSESLIKCRFHNFGCMERLKRKDETMHMEDAAVSHQLKLIDAMNALKKENDELKAKIIDLEEKQVRNEKIINEVIDDVDKLPHHYSNGKLVYVANNDGKLKTYNQDTHRYESSSSGYYTAPFHKQK